MQAEADHMGLYKQTVDSSDYSFLFNDNASFYYITEKLQISCKKGGLWSWIIINQARLASFFFDSSPEISIYSFLLCLPLS